MSTRTKILVAVAALAVLAIALGRGGEESRQVQELQDDPMASYVPPAGTLVDTETQNEGTSLGKPVPARVTRLFTVGSAGALDDARSAAAAAGWQPAGGAGKESFVGTKRGRSGRIALTLVLLANPRLLPDGVDPPALSVSLRRLGP